MQVVQSVNGKFHHFHLARYLYQREMLAAIFATYPSWKLRDEQIPMSLIHTYSHFKTPWLFGQRYGLPGTAINWEMMWRIHLTFDNYVAKHLPECDVFVGLSSSALKSGQAAQRRGGKYICDKPSSHMRFATEILTEEFRRWGQEFRANPPRTIHREEEEYAQADAVTVPSEFVRRTFIQMGFPAEKVKKIPYGADMSRFSKVGDPPADSFEALFVGQISFRKGVPYLLEAFEKLRHPNKRLTLIGAMMPDMKRYLQGKTLDNVTFPGILPSAQLKEHMSRSHVMALPSLEEGLAYVQGEALACGCPVICSENTGGDDLFDNGVEGFIVPIRDPKAITERLEQLAQDPALREKMSANAMQRVKGIGGWDNYGASYVALLESLTGAPQAVRQ